MKRRLPPIFYNGMTLFGVTFAVVMLIVTVILIVIDVFSGFSHGYGGLITYIALPGMMFFGLFIALIGLMRARKRALRGELPDELPIIDLNVSKQRHMVVSFAVGGLVLMALSGFGSYKGYEYTESVQFCGTTCHNLMKPEYTAYQNSPHARVTCAGCHIGSGVDWYVKSKLSGSYQVYSTLFNKYERPIKTPIRNLRPAKETCEQCHWPKHFFAQKLRTHEYFLSDDTNTAYELGMLVKIGGGEGTSAQGIHAHMYLDSQVTYVAADRERQEIPYVEIKDKSGKVTIYRDKSIKFSDAQLKTGERRIVDCIDCHNRPTHIFHPGEFAVNAAMSAGSIDPTIPEIKMKATEVLDAKYNSTEEAVAKIATDIRAYYKASHADFLATGSAKLEAAIAGIQDIYKKNYFPEMRTDWRSHFDNLDHIHSNGCFRCHDDKHVSDDGKVISKNCQTCHTIVSQGKKTDPKKTSFEGLEFQHPMDVGDAWKTQPCKDCHGPQPAE